jgi:carbonic anhydrase/acetyltransferase-like protein (isoleucine patch superfamily)
MAFSSQNIRPNPAGDRPAIQPSAFIDPSAQIIGNVRIDANVFIGPLAVIRADEPGADGKIKPVVIEAGTNIQDGVIIHSMGGTSVRIGPKASIAHGVVIHGPCVIGEESFVALRTVIYSATIKDFVWVGMGSIIMRATIPSHIMVPAGAVIRSQEDARFFRTTHVKEQNYQKDVLVACHNIRQAYKALDVTQEK